MYFKYLNYVTTVILLAILGIPIASLVLVIQVDTSYAQVAEGPTVETSVGVIRGLQAEDGDYSMFLGIKYAQVNRSNPFGVPIPITYFEGGFNAFDDYSICPQEEEFNFTIAGNLDCLDINIYVPNPISLTNKLPVMLNIFGGKFEIGFPGRFLYGPKFLTRHDVILVTLNYRLGLYGFLNLNTPENPGNQGLKDQLLAMRWVKKNIQYFGGNPDDITIFGNSAGASSIDFHMYSDHEILFNKVILQSVTSVTGISSGSTHFDQLLQLTEYLGVSTDNANDAIEFLASVDELLVIKAAKDLDLDFSPTVEKDIFGVERFITNYTIFKDIPKAKNISLLVGFTDGEFDTMYEPANLDIFPEFLSTFFIMEGEQLQNMSNIIRKFYIGDETELTSDVRYRICDFVGDITFVHAVTDTINKYMENEAKSVYQYFFSYVGDRNFVRHRENLKTARAIHGDELGYLFDISYMTSEITPEDQLIIDRITTLWTNFAKYGDPTPTLTPLLPVRWLPVTSENSYYYTIDTEVSLGSAPVHDRTAFWDLFYLLNEKFQNAYFDMI